MPHAAWTNVAQDDLRSIARYIVARDGRRRTARKITREIRDKCEHYARHPLTGTARGDLGDGLRIFSYQRWVVVFRPIDEGIEIIRVFDGSQDWEQLV